MARPTFHLIKKRKKHNNTMDTNNEIMEPHIHHVSNNNSNINKQKI